MPRPAPVAAEPGQWIVQARLPARNVEVDRSADGSRFIDRRLVSKHSVARRAKLLELYEYVSSVLNTKPVLLNAAGAVSVTASPAEIELISKHPLVKDIQPNRRRKLAR